MNYQMRRKKVGEELEKGDVCILFSGIEQHISADEYAPFEANRNFFYLTGLRRENMVLVLDYAASEPKSILFIERADETKERWFGKKVTVEEAKECSGIEDIRFIDTFESWLDRLMTREDVKSFYFDCYRNQFSDLETYNLYQARLFAKKYPGIMINNAFPILAGLRMEKDEDEIAKMRQAIAITDNGLKRVMRKLKPEQKEYQVQAEFEYAIHYAGAESVAFPTIAGSGKNGTMLHYETNQDVCKDGSLILLDLGAKYEGYCADITRTYPVNGVFSKRQREVYEIVLEANRAVAETATPGMTIKELDDVCKEVLAEGCMRLGLIQEKEEIGRYYMHSISHHLGIDVHDVTVDRKCVLQPGMVITDEPGLYIDEWEIGIRIEDDLLITEDGCEVLSEEIMRDPDEIEQYMKQHAE
ncbi:MAG: aminopeptidase P N-terminal domain-containing protein [Lachnospiraceae bacterium]